MPLSAIERVMEVYKHRQVNLARDLDILPYHICKWLDRKSIPAHFILRVVKAAINRDEYGKLPPKGELIEMFLFDFRARFDLDRIKRGKVPS